MLMRRGMAGMVVGQRPAMIARTRRAHMEHRTGSSAGRYYRSGAEAPKVANLAELWRSRAWSASKTSTVAKSCREHALPAVRSARHRDVVGAVQRRELTSTHGEVYRNDTQRIPTLHEYGFLA